MNRERFAEKYGPWAIVTGASSGIGVEFARQLAAMGLNLVMIARRVDNMEKLGADLAAAHGIVYKALQIDLTEEGFYDRVREAVSGLEIGLLVNNAGMNCEGTFYRGGLERNVRMMRLNMEASFILAHEIGRDMVDRGRGGIIFVGSTAGFQPMPYFTHYAATKAYILSLAQSMQYEFRSKGVDVTAVCPGPTESEMSRGIKDNPMVMKPGPVVEAAFRALGSKTYTVPGIGNKIGSLLPRVVGRRWSMEMMGALLKKGLPANRKA